ncbi:dTDP-4-dehydrorhamnose reductase [Jannaschia faecimaris]|uniref:dTDP-4-dehydrorhamnose reductase n=1 Tax=Jannaschia faecimaris TaxID=1244108 RepID=A0A1H3K6H2_9RHOB|nr:dTDP-4-dehydrorhamnose reductase [Jannaschia faecimaris]SDY47812.1 dTDP-4-dehydrorhamnose reductase [Jannaschia faecimaris]
MRILVFGRTGQVATELVQQAETPAFETMKPIFMGREAADLTNPEACAEAITGSDWDAVINAAAYTAVDAAETDEATAQLVNGTAPAAMARACADAGIPLVHISTDYVFDGSGTNPWRPGDATGPLGAYGRSKLAGEQGLRAASGPHAILRTAWVFSANGTNFVKTMLRLGDERDALSIVADQVGGPTPAADIAAACLTLAGNLASGAGPSGTYHFAGTPDITWADFARAIFAKSGIRCAVTDISTSAFPTAAARPANSRLDCSDITRDHGIARPDWDAGLNRVLATLRPRP